MFHWALESKEGVEVILKIINHLNYCEGLLVQTFVKICNFLLTQTSWFSSLPL